MMVDLDALEALERKATPRPWRLSKHGNYDGHHTIVVPDQDLMVFPGILHMPKPNSDLLLALREAAPDLFAELRTLRRLRDELLKLADVLVEGDSMGEAFIGFCDLAEAEANRLKGEGK
jgi:hypothetical protein